MKVTCRENLGWNVLHIRSMIPLMSNSKLFKFMTFQKLIKKSENFVRAFFSEKVRKVYHKNRDGGLASGSI